MILEGKTIIVTGVGVGLGKEVAKVALRDGANVVICARNESRLQDSAKELDPGGKNLIYKTVDINNAEECEAVVSAAIDAFGQVDGLIQVAAQEDCWGGLFDTDFDKWRAAYDTNVIGALTMMRAVATAMKKSGKGSIVLIGSQSMFIPQMEQAGYAATKGALLTTMRYLAKELGPDGIRVNHVIPSWMWGPNVEMLMDYRAKSENKTKQEAIDDVAGEFPLGRFSNDEEVAEATAFFVSDRSSAITGQYLLVNSGEMMPQ